jgi:hypothetical protein
MFTKPPYIVYVDQIGLDPKRNGLAIWPFIWIKLVNGRTHAEYKTLIKHEEIHHRQQIRGWHVGFYLKYLYYQVKYGYENNPYEIEAYEHQDD